MAFHSILTELEIGVCCKNTIFTALQRIYQKMQNIRNIVSNFCFKTTKKKPTNQYHL